MSHVNNPNSTKIIIIKVSRQNNTIYIQPNFKSPVAEFDSKDIQIQKYTVCAFDQEANKGLGRIKKYYAVMPKVKNQRNIT